LILEDVCEPPLNRTCRASTVAIKGWNEAQREDQLLWEVFYSYQGKKSSIIPGIVMGFFSRN